MKRAIKVLLSLTAICILQYGTASAQSVDMGLSHPLDLCDKFSKRCIFLREFAEDGEKAFFFQAHHDEDPPQEYLNDYVDWYLDTHEKDLSELSDFERQERIPELQKEGARVFWEKFRGYKGAFDDVFFNVVLELKVFGYNFEKNEIRWSIPAANCRIGGDHGDNFGFNPISISLKLVSCYDSGESDEYTMFISKEDARKIYDLPKSKAYSSYDHAEKTAILVLKPIPRSSRVELEWTDAGMLQAKLVGIQFIDPDNTEKKSILYVDPEFRK
jgi:hypothetical protein